MYSIFEMKYSKLAVSVLRKEHSSAPPILEPRRDPIVARLLDEARTSEKEDRLHEVPHVMKKLMELGVELNEEERNLLLTAYTKVIDGIRSDLPRMTPMCRDIFIAHILSFAKGLLDFLDEVLIPNAVDPESKISYMKMKGKYYAYLAEVVSDEEKEATWDESRKAYREAIDFASSVHPIMDDHIQDIRSELERLDSSTVSEEDTIDDVPFRRRRRRRRMSSEDENEEEL